MTPTTLGAEKQHGSSTDTISKMDGVQLSRGDTITMTPELFEKLYFSPPNVVKGDLRKTFANPTPVALAGMCLTLTPLACQLVGWRGADGSGSANNGVHFFCGGLLMLVGGLFEFVLGNTFSFVVFCSFAGFWLSLGATLAPGFGAISPFVTEAGVGVDFYNSFAFYFLFMGLLSFIYLICSVRTNVLMVGIFLGLTIAFPLLTAAYWNVGEGNAATAATLQHGAGGTLLVVSGLAWYAFLAAMLLSVDFPIDLPVGDLSTTIRGKSDRAAKEQRGE
ncbi:GPR1/FUN34/yaaH family-domain-containing protein [Tricharina praecox]|uniref:GPR1/FUN34/yaaH family-domain-containing protein n=1 Tax=Tricharina praecox TaxID=43433 RepID=UPI00221FA2C1|nr:GPR1/FUN34/yaaH family-domain-containing protein [Tricharina praecox]KAI5856878.1 GPR1/FUN34/yaaH family-domain-containing protein [Tricharina praecox]